MSSEVKLTIRHGHVVQTLSFSSRDAHRLLTELLRRADLPLNTRCGQHGLCDGCVVELVAGSLLQAASGKEIRPPGQPLPLRACEHRLGDADAEIHVPVRSLLAHEPQVVTSFRVNVPRADDPLWQHRRVRTADVPGDVPLPEAVAQAIAAEQDDPAPVRADPRLAQAVVPGRDRIDVAVEYLGDHWLVRPLPLARGRVAYGAAVDVGTTTVVVSLIDLSSGEVVSTASELNAQASLGDNVVTRINRCLQDRAMIAELQSAVVAKTLAPLLEQVLGEAGAHVEQLVALTIAGNTTMLHLFAGVDPSSMGLAPFTPQFLDHRVLRLCDLPVPALHEDGAPDGNSVPSATASPAAKDSPAVHLLPGAAAYIGADITAGVFATGMAYRTDTCMLVDIGTNGEIVLKHGAHLLGCATAAGPAFEGSGLKCGMRAGRGAISHVRIEAGTLASHIEVIGEGKPIGLCGTAYIDLIGQGRRLGLLTPSGRFSAEHRRGARFVEGRYGPEFLIAYGRGKEPMVVSEPDIASLLQAKAAIAAGIVTLLGRVGLTAEQVDTLYLAGGFGFHMDIANLLACGMLPGFRAEQIQVVGNTSLGGAYLALLDVGVLEAIKRIGQQLESVELNLEPSFESTYIDHLMLP